MPHRSSARARHDGSCLLWASTQLIHPYRHTLPREEHLSPALFLYEIREEETLVQPRGQAHVLAHARQRDLVPTEAVKMSLYDETIETGLRGVNGVQSGLRGTEGDEHHARDLVFPGGGRTPTRPRSPSTPGGGPSCLSPCETGMRKLCAPPDGSYRFCPTRFSRSLWHSWRSKFPSSSGHARPRPRTTAFGSGSPYFFVAHVLAHARTSIVISATSCLIRKQIGQQFRLGSGCRITPPFFLSARVDLSFAVPEFLKS